MPPVFDRQGKLKNVSNTYILSALQFLFTRLVVGLWNSFVIAKLVATIM